MNYYERYGGDYSRDTGHLSLAEHGAYTLLLDAYYGMERPFEAPYVPLYRVCRAMSKPEQTAVRAVADEFFPVGPDGLRHNARADRDIAKAQKRIITARNNGKNGGRHPKENEPDDNPTGSPLGNPLGSGNGRAQEPGGLLAENPTGSPPATQPGEALPDPMHHSPSPTKNLGGRARGKPRKSALPPNFRVSPRVQVWAASKGYDRLPEYLEAFVGKVESGGLTYADWDAAFMNSIREDWGKVRERKTEVSNVRRLSL